MHIPDGFLTVPVWGGLAAVTAPAVAWASRKAGDAAGAAAAPRMGVLGAFVFAAQMINFPVGLGASGHLVGSALLTAVLGPAAATVVMTAILVIQALVFQDGGLLALGANTFNMGVAGVWLAAAMYKALPPARWIGGFAGGFVSVFAAGILCLGQLGLSGVRYPGSVLALSLVVFLITAALEGVITASVLRALERMQPGWVAADGRRARPVMAALLLAAVGLSLTGFLFASTAPDGLERLAGLAGLEGKEAVLLSAPLPDYEALAAGNPWLRKAVPGLAGLLLTYALVAGLARLTLRPRSA
ncbi:MAG: energy-coupling factor ABC transporter permease [Anaerolineae bacterium]|nr:energy-coupling factor ABC transporter permease [Anaerolineae bacterium]